MRSASAFRSSLPQSSRAGDTSGRGVAAPRPIRLGLDELPATDEHARDLERLVEHDHVCSGARSQCAEVGAPRGSADDPGDAGLPVPVL